MSASNPAATACAIYTRKSSEEGLDQAFNSLDAQREACEAYIVSQKAEGWRALPTRYDDGGFSGGTMDRPALKRLLDDIDAGRVRTIVVYKVDRLTRSLADFAKIVERLDAAGASFVSVTQPFNTTTSMGRLTLNVLLSFAQFEREVTGERIRDKIAASKAKGMWMGGVPPLGYDLPTDRATRALVLNDAEAVTVRMIFAAYLELGSVSALEAHLATVGIPSKAWTSAKGRAVGGCRINRGALYYMLKNRLYLGEIPHGGRAYPGAHPPIVDVDLFERVQARLAEHCGTRRTRQVISAPLRGLLFDIDGAPMSPTFTHGRSGRVHRYYVSAPLQQGRRPPPTPNAVRRVAAGELERLLRDELAPRLRMPTDATLLDMLPAIHRIEIEATCARVVVRRSALTKVALEGAEPCADDDTRAILRLSIQCQRRGGQSWIIAAPGSSPALRRDPSLIRALGAAHRLAAGLGWRSTDGALEMLSAKAPALPHHRKTVRLAFLAPDLQQDILDGRQPSGLTLDRLNNQPIPLSWVEQRRLFRRS